jgi:hypothetical protein
MQPIETLKEDFSQTLGFIDKCDNHIFQIKNWAIVTSSAVIAYSISQKYEALVLVNLGLLVAFMYLELIYKSFQDSAIEHISDISRRIDKFLANETADLLAGYTHSFGRKLKYPSIFRALSILANHNRWHILNFYLLLGAISFVAFKVVAK